MFPKRHMDSQRSDYRHSSKQLRKAAREAKVKEELMRQDEESKPPGEEEESLKDGLFVEDMMLWVKQKTLVLDHRWLGLVFLLPTGFLGYPFLRHTHVTVGQNRPNWFGDGAIHPVVVF